MYTYEEVKPEILTDDGQRLFLEIRDRAHQVLKEAGAFRMEEVIRKSTGDSWHMLACVDRMVELGEIREINDPIRTMGQHRVFVKR